MKKILCIMMTLTLALGSLPVYADPAASEIISENTAEDVLEESDLSSTDNKVEDVSTDVAEKKDDADSEQEADQNQVTDPKDKESSDESTENRDTEGISGEEENLDVEENVEEAPAEAVAKQTTITVSEKGIATVTATGYDVPSNAKEVSIAVWSRPGGQDDLKWYKQTKTTNGFKTEVDLKNHGGINEIYYFHLYYKSAAGQMVCFSTKDLTVEDVFPTKVAAEKTSSGYKLTLTSPTVTPAKTEFAIWSDEGGQDDLKWYTASYNSNTKTATLNWTTADLKHNGKVIMHCYVTDQNGKKAYQGYTEVTVTDDSVKPVVAATKTSSGYTLTLTDPSVTPAKVEFAIWSDEGGQDDLKWYTASYNATTKKASYNWTDADLKHSGRVIVHCYVNDAAGKKTFQGGIEITVEKKTSTSKTEIIQNSNGTCELRAVNYSVLENATNIRVAVWSDKNGQDDLKWYHLKRSTETVDGKQNIVWSYQMNLKDHGGENGKYHVHFYYDTSVGQPVCISADSFNVENAPEPTTEPEITISETGSGYKLALKNPSVTPAKVEFAIWSEEGGQDDLIWHQASYNSTSKTATLNWNGQGLKHSGLVHIHVYVTDSKGKKVFQGKDTVTVAAPAPANIKASYTMSSGAFKLTFTKGGADAKKVVAAVWTDSKQADLKWYTMTENADGTWTYSGNIKNHNYRHGTYQVHIYVTDSAGVQTCLVKTTFDASDAGSLKVNPVTANKQYSAVVSGLTVAAVKSVSVAVWSDKGGQDDLKWYTAVKDGNNFVATIPIHNHLTSGLYIAHAYVTDINGKQYNTKALQTTFTVEEVLTTDYSYLDRITDNGTFVVDVKADTYCPVKALTFTVWTEENGADAEQLSAMQQSDGSWAAVVSVGKHGYSYGPYRISCSATLSNGAVLAGAESAFSSENSAEFITVVNSESSATGVVKGFTDARTIVIYVWSINGGQDDLKAYTPIKTETGWTCEYLKKNHGSAGIYRADLYVNDVCVAVDQFSFDEYRYADTWYSIATAHAAGGQGNNRDDVYTNCVTAMNASYDLGYRTYEIDVLLTSDHKPVLFHTWKTAILDKYKYSAATSAGPTYAEFMKDTMYGGKYATSDFGDLLDYLIAHPDVKILLDTKYRSASEISSLFTILVKEATAKNARTVLRNQIIPYFFTTETYNAINNVFTFKEYHYATYAAFPKGIGSFSTSSIQNLLQFCKMNRVLSISMWDCLATADVVRMANSYGINVYVHTTDDPATAERLLKLGVAGIIGNKIDPVQAVGMIS